MNRLFTAALALGLMTAPALTRENAAPLKVLIWDEEQEAQKQVYPNYLGNWIAESLNKQEGIQTRSVSIKDPDQGLSDENIEWADVVVWWGHQKHGQVADAPVAKIVDRVKAGKCGLVALHSAHWSKPFKLAMLERFKQDVLAKLPATVDKSKVEWVKKKEGKPEVLSEEEKDGKHVITIVVPNCGLGGVRADGAPGHLETKLAQHPIAKGVPATFDVAKTEMYNEPFTVPEPDAVVFFETWDKGEKFRSGCCWALGEGRVFYFRPGHETFPVFHQEETLKVVHNAVLWSGKRS
ncbi:MAG TPA: ThuA domain-containing protein [Planctomycetota bacterium]|nr:ThuA domain-containing protein [Planctomycetota bacterium]